MALAGCGRTVVSVEDVILRPETTRLCAYVQRQPLPAIRRALGGITVTFAIDGTTLGTAKTDLKGRAELTIPTEHIPAKALRMQASAERNGSTATSNAGIFDWRDEDVIIAVDLDETICDVEYHTVIFNKRDMGSRPIPGSIDALKSLADEFHILYSSARPRFLLEKSRVWIEDHDYPPGPLLGGSRVRDCLRQGGLKRAILKEMQAYVPNLLIGIGDKAADVKAYTKRSMLTLIYSPRGEKFNKDVLVFRDWASLAQFIHTNREVLKDPVKVRKAIAGEIQLAQSPHGTDPSKLAGTATASTSRGSSLNSPPP